MSNVLKSFFVIFLLMILSCKGFHNENFNNDTLPFSWLIGEWKCEQDGQTVLEKWEKVNNYSFKGSSFLVENGKKTLMETIELAKAEDGIYYIPKVKDQNSGKAVLFKLTFKNGTEVVFENPEHDFPQKIKYQKINKDSIEAEISGNISGKLKTQKFPMQRAD